MEYSFPEFHFTEEMKTGVLENPEKYTKCDARICTEKFYTDEEYEDKILESLNRSLSGDKKTPY